MKLLKYLVISLVIGAAPFQAQAVAVDAELSLVIDVSGSVNGSEYNLMMDGYANAFRNTTIQNNIINGTAGQIAVNVVFFATSAIESIGYTLLDSVAAINTFANTLDAFARPGGIGSSTGIFNGVNLARNSLLANNGFESSNLIIDVSGDGTNNSGSSPTVVRDLAEADPLMTINGITIGAASIETYYKDNVVTSDGFTVHSNSFAEFETGIINKLKVETNTTGGNNVPEPTAITLMGLALLGFASRRLRA